MSPKGIAESACSVACTKRDMAHGCLLLATNRSLHFFVDSVTYFGRIGIVFARQASTLLPPILFWTFPQ